MSLRNPFRLLLVASALSAAAIGQTAPAPCSPATRNGTQAAAKPCPSSETPPAATPPASPAQQFPFPGEANTPNTSAPNAPRPSADTAHPFPAESPDLPGADSSSSSSSSSSSGSSDAPDATRPSTRRKLPKVRKLQTPDERVDEDISVAKFYLNRDNFNAAYMRSKDAVQTEPDYAETHYSLAVAAQKLKKLDEAKVEYNTYLKLAPDGDNAKAARKALQELQ